MLGLIAPPVVLSVLLGLAAWRSPLHSLAWTAGEIPEWKGPYQTNEALKQVEEINLQGGKGPEDVAFDATGKLYTGTEDGQILRVTFDKKGPTVVEPFSDTKGRPLGLAFDGSGNLLVADAVQGLIQVDRHGKLQTLVNTYDNKPLLFADAVTVARNGLVYFTDVSTEFTLPDTVLAVLNQKPDGRLFMYDPNTEKATIEADGLYFPNGVALSQNEDFLVVAETSRYRLMKHWLKGPKKGQTEVFLDNLPGMPDGVSANGEGKFWVALVAPRDPQLESLLLPHPMLKNLVGLLPRFLYPKSPPFAMVIGVDESGKVVSNLQDQKGTFVRRVTSAREHQGQLFIGNLQGHAVGMYRLKPL